MAMTMEFYDRMGFPNMDGRRATNSASKNKASVEHYLLHKISPPPHETKVSSAIICKVGPYDRYKWSYNPYT